MLTDVNGQKVDVWPTQNQWASRAANLSSYAGKTITNYQVVTDTSTPAGTYDSYYDDMAIVSTDGTVHPIYFRQMGGTLANQWNTGQTNLSAVEESPHTAAEAVSGQYATTYYHGDQLGSARLLTAGEGWPVSSDTFYPFGLEQTAPADTNHYKYTGLERDAESGLDHAAFRTLADLQGRWLSPDPYDGSYDLTNPQSFNRYSYVGNNPLRFTDPSGRQCQTTQSVTVYGDGSQGDYFSSALSCGFWDVVEAVLGVSSMFL